MFSYNNIFYRKNFFFFFAYEANRFYSNVRKQLMSVKEPLTLEGIQKFWKRIFGDYKVHNKNAEWIRNIEETYRNLYKEM